MINEHNFPKFPSPEPLWDLSWELGSLGPRPVCGLLALPIFRPAGDSLENRDFKAHVAHHFTNVRNQANSTHILAMWPQQSLTNIQ
jgi:hypothetical protein